MMPTGNELRVLMIDDDIADRELARLALGKAEFGTFKIMFASSLTEADDLLGTIDHDVLLLDLGLPESSGMETLLKVREVNRSIPVVVLTDLCDEETAMACLNNGAQDYLLKSQLALDTLSRAIRYAIQRQQLHEQLKCAFELLEQRNSDLARLCDTAQRFVDNVSHEFRSPLTVITEYVALLQEGVVGQVELDEEQRRFLGILADRADDLNTMVDDMLDVSKLQAGLLSTWKRDCQLSDILRHVGPALESKARIKNVQLDFSCHEDLPPAYCDGEKLGRVIINLVVNAIKFCGNPGRVHVSSEINAERGEILISVTDNGPGISREDQQKIFSRFQQIDEHGGDTQEGFGLGLSIAKELVELNLGEMYLESEVGRGSTFSFSVPLANPVGVIRRYADRLRVNDASVDLAIIEAKSDPQLSTAEKEEVDAFLNYALRPEDLLFRDGDHRWLMVLPLTNIDVAEFRCQLDQSLSDTNRNRPHHPLPEFQVEQVGVWRVGEQAATSVCLEELFSEQEVLHV